MKVEKTECSYQVTECDLKYGKQVMLDGEVLIPISVLNKIRVEIEDVAFDWQEIDGEHESFMVVDLNDALRIIDKYKAESEG